MSAGRRMAEVSAFLEAIREAPDSAVPRLVFADWLEEQGEEVFGSCLRLLAQAQECQTGEDIDRVQRAFFLYEAYAQAWLGDAWRLECLPFCHDLRWKICGVRIASYGTPSAKARQGHDYVLKVGNIGIAYHTPLQRDWVQFSSAVACLSAAGFVSLRNKRAAYWYMAAPPGYQRGTGAIGRAAIPDREGLRSLAEQLHTRRANWYGLVLGWPASYQTTDAEGACFRIGCSSTWETRICWRGPTSVAVETVSEERLVDPPELPQPQPHLS